MKRMHVLRIIIPLTLSLMLTACGLHMRNSASIPPELHRLYVYSPQPYSPFITLLKSQLEALDIDVVDSPTKANYTLAILSTTLTHSNPPIGNTSYAYSYAFTYHVGIALRTKDDVDVAGPYQFYTTRSLLLNTNQIYTSGARPLLQRELQRDMVNKIYDWLASTNLHRELKHATQTKPTRTTSTT